MACLTPMSQLYKTTLLEQVIPQALHPPPLDPRNGEDYPPNPVARLKKTFRIYERKSYVCAVRLERRIRGSMNSKRSWQSSGKGSIARARSHLLERQTNKLLSMRRFRDAWIWRIIACAGVLRIVFFTESVASIASWFASGAKALDLLPWPHPSELGGFVFFLSSYFQGVVGRLNTPGLRCSMGIVWKLIDIQASNNHGNFPLETESLVSGTPILCRSICVTSTSSSLASKVNHIVLLINCSRYSLQVYPWLCFRASMLLWSWWRPPWRSDVCREPVFCREYTSDMGIYREIIDRDHWPGWTKLSLFGERYLYSHDLSNWSI